jgi:hypothetical protein
MREQRTSSPGVNLGMSTTLSATLGGGGGGGNPAIGGNSLLNVQQVNTGSLNSYAVSLIDGVGGLASLAHILSNGTGANQANKVWYDERTLTASSTDDLDLTNLTLNGVTVTFSKIKWVILRVVFPATGVKIVFGGAVTNVFLGWLSGTTPTEDIQDLTIRLANIDGWAVDSTHKIFQLNNPGGTSVTYDIILIGS